MIQILMLNRMKCAKYKTCAIFAQVLYFAHSRDCESKIDLSHVFPALCLLKLAFSLFLKEAVTLFNSNIGN